MRPSRPTHPDLTNDIWELVERCWNQEPRYRPDTSEVVLRLQNHTRDLRCDRAEVPDDQTTDNTTLMSVRGDGSSIGESRPPLCSRIVRSLRSEGLCPQPPRWTPISRVLQTLSGFVRLPSMPRFVSGAENVRNAGSEHGAPASDPSRRERSWFSGCNPFRRSESGSERIKTGVCGIPESILWILLSCLSQKWTRGTLSQTAPAPAVTSLDLASRFRQWSVPCFTSNDTSF